MYSARAHRFILMSNSQRLQKKTRPVTAAPAAELLYNARSNATLRMMTNWLVMLLTTHASSACPNSCRGRGICLSSGKCSCFKGFSGFDCKLRACPLGHQWTGIPTATDDVHTAWATCSNMGVCDESTGKCACRSGFGGPACGKRTT